MTSSRGAVALVMAVATLCGCVSVQAAETSEPRQRIRDLGITIGQYPTGPLNTITDVAGVKVGHTTLISGEGPLKPGTGPGLRYHT